MFKNLSAHHNCHFWLPVSSFIGMSFLNSGRVGPCQSLKKSSTGLGIGFFLGIGKLLYRILNNSRIIYFESLFLSLLISRGGPCAYLRMGQYGIFLQLLWHFHTMHNFHLYTVHSKNSYSLCCSVLFGKAQKHC